MAKYISRCYRQKQVQISYLIFKPSYVFLKRQGQVQVYALTLTTMVGHGANRKYLACSALLTFFLSSPRVSVWRFFFNFVFYLSSSFLDKKPGSSCADTNSLKCYPSFCPTLEWVVPNPLRTLGGWAKRRMTFQTQAQKP